MTNLAFNPSATGSGTVTVNVPSINTSNTVSLPSISGGTLLENTNPTVNQLNGGQLAGMRNKIINGKMDIAQRGTSFAAAAHEAYSLDRFVSNYSTTAVVTASQQTDVPSSNEFQNSLRVAVTTADTSIAATDYWSMRQRIEGFNVRDLIGRTFTLSFWVRSSKTGTHCVGFFNSGHDRTYVAEYTVSAANTWEYKSVTVSGGLITAGTWNWTNGVGLQVAWMLACGTTYQTTAGAWQTGTFLATSSQVNCLDTIGNIFAITGVQLELGTVATPFEHRFHGAELALCQRYYETGGAYSLYSGNVTTTNIYYAPIRFAVVKRAAPSAISFTDVANSQFPAGVPTAGVISTDGFYVSKTANGTGTGYYQFNWTAAAEL